MQKFVHIDDVKKQIESLKIKKTFKRETAGFLFIFLIVLSFYGVVVQKTPAIDLIQIFIMPIFTFAYMAFGADVYSKQMDKKNKSQENNHEKEFEQ